MEGKIVKRNEMKGSEIGVMFLIKLGWDLAFAFTKDNNSS